MARTIYLTEEQFRELNDNEQMGKIVGGQFSFEQLNSLKSFNGRIRYCENYLQRISQGSSRIVYRFDDNTVLKLAKNTKGLAQNEEEVSKSNESDIFAHIFKFDVENSSWIVSEYARRATAADFRRLTGHDFKFVQKYIELIASQYSRHRRWNATPEQEEFLENVMNMDIPNWEFFYEINEYMTNYQLEAWGDLTRPSTWGVANRQNGDELVIVDYGLSDEVADKHYNNRRKIAPVIDNNWLRQHR